MFKVKAMVDGYPILIPNQIYTVYNIRNDKKGYPHFLIYTAGMWLWKSAKLFKPVIE